MKWPAFLGFVILERQKSICVLLEPHILYMYTVYGVLLRQSRSLDSGEDKMKCSFQTQPMSDLLIAHAQLISWVADHKSELGVWPTIDQTLAFPGHDSSLLEDLSTWGILQVTGDGHLIITEECKPLPVIGSVAAGSPIEAIEHQQGQLNLPLECFRERPTYLLRVRGDSMIDAGIREGDLIAIRKTSQAGEGKIVVARVDNEVTVKRLKLSGDQVALMPANKQYQPLLIASDALTIEGVFVGLIRDQRPIH